MVEQDVEPIAPSGQRHQQLIPQQLGAPGHARAVPSRRFCGRPTSTALLEHSYLLAMCNLHVLLGYPLLDLPAPQRFEALIDRPAPARVAAHA